ncbi:hypothetical protein [Pseudomonas sp. USHLN015]|uniref:hypothetical protein n=1 Tax=Pseudomonas sp. USHLN015 TaxID=3081296 RepID=UPI00301D84C4
MNKEQREQLASDLLAEAEHRRGRVVDLLRNAAAALAAQPMEAEAKLGSQQSSLDFGAILRHGKEALLRVGEAALSPPPTVLSSVPAAIRTAFLDGYRQGIHDEFVNEEAAWNRSRSIHVAHNAEQHGTLPASEQQQAVVMPPIKGLPDVMMATYHEAKGWNAYNAELLRLNPHLQPAAPADWCKTMDRPKSQCGCPDCGSSLVQVDGYSELPSQGGDA